MTGFAKSISESHSIMKAAWYSSNGPAREVLVVGELPTPVPSPGEVRVKLATSGVNPSDVKSRRRPLPYEQVVPHSDGAGVVDAIGDGVSQERIGQRVWVWNGQWQRPMGTAAEYIVVPEAQAVPLPDNTGFDAGACLGIPALTAFQAVRLLGDISGKTVLVTGAGSAVGHYVTQLAVLGSARVIGTVGSAERAAHAMAAGAFATVDYKQEPVANRIRELTEGRGVDAIVDMDFSSTSKLIADGVLVPHGTVVSYGSNSVEEHPVPFRTLLFSSITLRFFLVYDLTPADRQFAIEGLNTLLAIGQLSHTIGARFGLDQIAAAHEAVEGGKVIGNVVLDLDR
jgi:NADPH2:quinone reductase